MWEIITGEQPQRGSLRLDAPDTARSAGKIIAHAVLINLLNPKLPLFFLAFLPQFMRSDSPSPTEDMLLLSAIFMLMTLLVFVGEAVRDAFDPRKSMG